MLHSGNVTRATWPDNKHKPKNNLHQSYPTPSPILLPDGASKLVRLVSTQIINQYPSHRVLHAVPKVVPVGKKINECLGNYPMTAVSNIHVVAS